MTTATVAPRPRVDSALMRVVSLERQVKALQSSLDRALLTVKEQGGRIRVLEKQHEEDQDLIAVLAPKALAYDTLKLKDSTNSSLPPSTNQNKRPYVEREKTGRKPGGQPGHAGTTMHQVPVGEVDEIIDVTPTSCQSCGEHLDTLPEGPSSTRQVQDVVIMRHIVNYTGSSKTCSCGRVNPPLFPEGVNSPVKHGDGVKALCIGLNSICLIPSRVTARYLEGFFGIHVTPASLVRWGKELGESLDSWDQVLREMARDCRSLHADETSYKVYGQKNSYLHVAATDWFTLMHLGGRGKKDILAGDIIKDFKGTIISDCLSSYWHVGAAANQACCAHLIRELKFAIDAYQPKNTRAKHPYPQLALTRDLIQAMIHEPDSNEQEAILKTIEYTTSLIDRTRPAREDKLMTDMRALMRRIRRLASEGDLYRFMHDPDVPPTNDMAEQAIRFAKIKQNRSKTHRSVPHSRTTIRVASYLDTARKNGIQPEEALKLALAGTPYTPTPRH